MTEKKIILKDETLSLVVRTYKRSRNIKAYYKGDVLHISKPRYLSSKEIDNFIKKFEDELYNEYKKIKSNKVLGIKKWVDGEEIFYKGNKYKIVTNNENLFKIKIDEENKVFYITSPLEIEDELRRETILKLIKKLFKNNTKYIVDEKLNYWSNITKIKYNSYKVHDAVSRYGSCIKSKKALNFSSRLIMLSEDKIDAVIVHELCHIEEANHSEKFYNLVQTYIPNYKEIDKWLKKNGNILNM